MFRKVLIANRGEIARRIARTCRRLGIAVATVHSDADRGAPHVRDIGESVSIGPAPAAASYLVVEHIVRAARQVGADAVHPGYGFLSENAGLAQALHDAGIAFIGPSPELLRAFGDKAAAKALARDAGLPTIAGSDGASDDPQAVRAMVERIGLPALLKAAAGGGGKGIRIVGSRDVLDDAIASAMREGRHAFGDGRLLVERHVAGGRHVEVQILGDGRGDVIHLWERECSLQRRHQKVVEEAPALPLPEGMRERLLAAAVALGRSVSYLGLGTVEFLVAGDAFWFLEVNPRLQVEHPVTEAITGLDVIELQLRAVAGEPLALRQHEVACNGHAIEARIYAEDPALGFVPCTGPLHRLSLPHGVVRVEAGVEAGSIVTPHYDPMIAKLVAHGENRPAALARLRAGLAQTAIAGLGNNLRFLEALLASPAVSARTPELATIDALLPVLPLARGVWTQVAPAVAAAYVLRSARSDDPEAPASAWRTLTHWRLGAQGDALPSHPHDEVQVGERFVPARVGVSRDDPSEYVVALGDATHRVGIEGPDDTGGLIVGVDGHVWRLHAGRDAGSVWLSDGRDTVDVVVRPAISRERGADAIAGAALSAPLTGTVLDVRVANGDAVAAGDVLMVIESMKMELRITSPGPGIVRALDLRPGARVERGAVLARVETRT